MIELEYSLVVFSVSQWGAGLVCQWVDSRWGIWSSVAQLETALREACGSPHTPAVFSSLAALKNWIQDQLSGRQPDQMY